MIGENSERREALVFKEARHEATTRAGFPSRRQTSAWVVLPKITVVLVAHGAVEVSGSSASRGSCSSATQWDNGLGEPRSAIFTNPPL